MVIGIITLLMGMLISGVIIGKRTAEDRAARIQLQTMSMTAMKYAGEWGEFPPFDPAVNTSNRKGAELLHFYLCKKHALGERFLGPYFDTNESNLHSGPNLDLALISPLHSFYTFGFEGKGDHRVQWVIVDPGRDKLLGGIMSAENGFVPDNSDANGDGKPDHLDNIVEKVSMR
jgi:type II secretory pathway pseudopilin PulG